MKAERPGGLGPRLIEDLKALLRGAPPVLGGVVAISDQEERDAK